MQLCTHTIYRLTFAMFRCIVLYFISCFHVITNAINTHLVNSETCKVFNKIMKPLQLKQEAHLSQRHRATHYVSWNLVNCCTAVWKMAFKKACSRWM